MFRKYYKEANDSIKPDEDFVSDVISSVKKRKPPAYRQYVRYGAVAAAGVAVVSAAVLSMPLWQRVDTSKDGIIIEETVSQTAPPVSDSSGIQESTPAAAPSAEAAQESNAQTTQKPKAQAREEKKAQTESGSTNQSNGSRGTGQSAKSGASNSDSAPNDFSSSVRSYIPQTAAYKGAPDVQEESKTEALPQETEQETKSQANEAENAVLQSEVEDTSDYDEATVTEETAMYSIASSGAAPEADVSLSASMKKARIEDRDIPTPSGYYCTEAGGSSYTFANDEGAVIVVTVTYGGEDMAPYISENGDSIYAVVCSYGMCVTVNASGADRSAVEEIIYSFG